MNSDVLATLSLVLAAIPAILFGVNLFFYRKIDSKTAAKDPVSVLIPARNEEANIATAIEAVLANIGCEFEIIVLNDDSTDRTAEIVGRIAERDSRVRLVDAPPLPAGWCGKQHACFVLAKLARHSTLLFIDADVRLAPDALRLMVGFLKDSRSSLASGVPRQEVGTFSERLLIPLIQFVLLGFLPMFAMRWTRRASFSAGCGQLFIAEREAYFASGGHSKIRNSLHDGVKLPRIFRKSGFRTDLFDATNLATCRMYRTNRETWRGLGKNATEGLAARGTIIPMTVLLFGGQVLPLLLLAWPGLLSAQSLAIATIALLMGLIVRGTSALRFRQPLMSVVLHPLGIAALLAIQWAAIIKSWFGRPAEWKGRAYLLGRVSVFLLLAMAASAGELPNSIELEDQFGTKHTLQLNTNRIVVLTVADQKGSSQVDAWVVRLKERFGNQIELHGIADIGGAPAFLRGRISRKMKESRKHPVLLDWSGSISKRLEAKPGVANIFLMSGVKVQRHVSGKLTPNNWAQIEKEVDRALSQTALR